MSNKKRKYFVYFQNRDEFIEVNKEFYIKFYRDVWALKKRLQRNGECVCPKSDFQYCDGDCFECKHHRTLTYSLEQALDDDSEHSLSEIEDDSFSVEMMIENSDLKMKIPEIISTLSENEKIMCYALMNGLSNREMKNLLKYKGNDGSFSEHKQRSIMKLRKKFKKVL